MSSALSESFAVNLQTLCKWCSFLTSGSAVIESVELFQTLCLQSSRSDWLISSLIYSLLWSSTPQLDSSLPRAEVQLPLLPLLFFSSFFFLFIFIHFISFLLFLTAHFPSFSTMNFSKIQLFFFINLWFLFFTSTCLQFFWVEAKWVQENWKKCCLI